MLLGSGRRRGDAAMRHAEPVRPPPAQTNTQTLPEKQDSWALTRYRIHQKALFTAAIAKESPAPANARLPPLVDLTGPAAYEWRPLWSSTFSRPAPPPLSSPPLGGPQGCISQRFRRAAARPCTKLAAPLHPLRATSGPPFLISLMATQDAPTGQPEGCSAARQERNEPSTQTLWRLFAPVPDARFQMAKFKRRRQQGPRANHAARALQPRAIPKQAGQQPGDYLWHAL